MGTYCNAIDVLCICESLNCCLYYNSWNLESYSAVNSLCLISGVIHGPEQWSNVQCALLRIFERMVEVGRDAKLVLYSRSRSTVRVLLRGS
jgi:hypothetical protein